MNTPRSIARFASCAPLRTLLGNTPMVRSQSLRHFSKASDKAAGAAQNYQNGLSLKPLGPKGYSQGPKDGKQGQNTLNQLHHKPAGTTHTESAKSPGSANQKDQRHNHEHVQKRESSFVQEENEGKGMQEENKKEEEEPAPPKDQTYQRFVKLLNFMKIYPPLAWDFLVRGMKYSANRLFIVVSWLRDLIKQLSPDTQANIITLVALGFIPGVFYYRRTTKQAAREHFEKMVKFQRLEDNSKAQRERKQAKDKATIHGFNKHSRKAAENKAKDADLIIKKDQSNLVRVLSFIGNKQWNLEGHFAGYADTKRFNIKNQKVLYIQGDPGIGKSTAFTSLVHNMNTGSTQVKASLKAAFPSLTDFEHFIYIDVSKYKFDDNWTAIVGDITKHIEQALVVFDDAHSIFLRGGEKALEFYYKLNDAPQVKCIVLLSSQGPPPQHIYFKDTHIKRESLYELDKIEAIVQLQNAIPLNTLIYPSIPPSLSRLIAYRLWFYLGGNFRAVNKLIGTVSVAVDYLCEKAGEMAMSEKVPRRLSKEEQPPEKSTKFPKVMDFLSQIYKGNLIEDLTNLEFESTHLKKSKKEGETTKDKEPKQEELKEDKSKSAILEGVGELEENNILIRKDKFRKGQGISTISFHSRRVHFAFNFWLAEQFLLHYQGNKDVEARLNFLKRLERVECKHILGFSQMPFLEMLEKERVSKLEAIKKILPSMTEEQKEKIFRIKMEPETARAIVKLMECQVDLVMFFFQLFQEGRKLQDFKSDNSQLREIIDDVKMGPAKFYKKYKTQIDSKMTKDKEKRRDKLEQKINENRTAQIVKLKNQLLGDLWEQCLSDFETLGGFKIQGAITKEDLKNLDRDEKKYQDAKKEIEKYLIEQKHVFRNQMLLMCLDLMKDLDYQMKWWDLEKIEEEAQEGKADKGAKQ